MGIIRKQNDEAFWLGANVGQTESVSHIPTQITSYKGINVPLTNWEKSFFEGYLLRCVSKKINRVCIFSLHRYASVKIDGSYVNVYMQNAKAVDYNCCYLILNSDKKKIDADGNVLPDDDKRVYRQKSYFNLPSGTYYYREISAYRSQMITEDVPFTVINSDTEQTVYIDHKPKLYKVYYDSSYTVETPFEDMTPYLNTSKQDYLSIYYYDESDSLSFSYSITPPSFIRLSYDIQTISFIDDDITDKYNINWSEGLLRASSIDGTIDLDCGATQIIKGETRNSVYGEQGQVIAHQAFVYKTDGIDNSKLKVPAYMTVDYGDKSYKQLMPTYLKLTDARYSCDIQWKDINNVAGYGQTNNAGYVVTSKHISGTSYSEYKDMEVSKSKNRHYGVQIYSREQSTLRNEVEENSVMWSGTHDDKHTITGGEITTQEYLSWMGAPISQLKSLADVLLKWYSMDINGYVQGSIWYYEDEDGNIEACSNYNSRINNVGNPVVSDELITKSFIGSLISYNEIKEGYEDYNF